MQLVRRRLGDTMDRDAVNGLLNDLSVDFVTRMNRLEQRLTESEGYFDNSIGEVSMEVGDMLAVVRGHTSEIEEMSSDVEETKQRMAELEASEQHRRTEDGDLRDRVAELEARANEAEVAREQLRQSMQAQQSSPENYEAIRNAIERLEKERERREDEYWQRCLYLRGFNGDPTKSSSEIYEYVRSKLIRSHLSFIADECRGFYICRRGGLRVELRSRAEAGEMLREWRRRLKRVNNRTLSMSFCVPPRYMDDKSKLTKIGMKMKRAGMLSNFEIRAVSARENGTFLRLETIRRTSSRVQKFYKIADMELLESLVNEVAPTHAEFADAREE